VGFVVSGRTTVSSRSPSESSTPAFAPASALCTESIDSSPLPVRPGFALRYGAGIVLAVWVLSLAVMAVISANPVTLNRDQIAHSSFLVTAKVIDRSLGTVDILKEWRRRAAVPSQSVTLSNLDQTGVRNGETYLMPLSKRPDGTLMVTETRMANGRPLVYPDGDESRKLLTDLLSELAAEERPVDTEAVRDEARPE